MRFYVRVYVSTCKCVVEYNSEYWSRWSSSRWCGVVCWDLHSLHELCCATAWQRREFVCLTKTFNPLANFQKRTYTNYHPSLKNRGSRPPQPQQGKQSWPLFQISFPLVGLLCRCLGVRQGKHIMQGGIRLMNRIFSFKLVQTNRREVCVCTDKAGDLSQHHLSSQTGNMANLSISSSQCCSQKVRLVYYGLSTSDWLQTHGPSCSRSSIQSEFIGKAW